MPKSGRRSRYRDHIQWRLSSGRNILSVCQGICLLPSGCEEERDHHRFWKVHRRYRQQILYNNIRTDGNNFSRTSKILVSLPMTSGNFRCTLGHSARWDKTVYISFPTASTPKPCRLFPSPDMPYRPIRWKSTYKIFSTA